MKKPVAISLVAGAAVFGLALTYISFNSPKPTDAPSAAAPAVTLPLAPAAPVRSDGFKDTSMLRPPAGAKVAIFEFEDLECPACAHAYPVVRAAAERYGIPLVRHDFPLTEIHVWSFDAAVTARYLQDRVSPALAEDFRRDVFASQNAISNKEDLARFTAKWFQGHGQTMPFVMDASGACKDEVKADRALGDRLGVSSTPCIVVVGQSGFVQIVDVDRDLYRAIDAATRT